MCENHVFYKLFEPLGPVLCWAKAKAVLGQAPKLRFGLGLGGLGLGAGGLGHELRGLGLRPGLCWAKLQSCGLGLGAGGWGWGLGAGRQAPKLRFGLGGAGGLGHELRASLAGL